MSTSIYIVEIERYQIFDLPEFLEDRGNDGPDIVSQEELMELWDPAVFEGFKKFTGAVQPDPEDPEYWDFSESKMIEWLGNHGEYLFTYWEFDSAYTTEELARARGEKATRHSSLEFRVRRETVFGS